MTITITLPDQSTRQFDAPITGIELAESIGAGLAKAAVAVKVDGQQRDIYLPIEHDAKVEILTSKQPEGLDVIRHTMTAQVLARTIKEMYPGTKLAIGPTIQYGFYYDVESPKPIPESDLPKIEARMREILKEEQPIKREMWQRDQAIKLFEDRGEPYKADIIKGAAADDTTEAGKISLYRQGEGEDAFVDLCRGPHVPSFKYLPTSFKLTAVSGAYWRGDSKGKQLSRIYGVMFANDKELKQHLTMLEEAEKRDHRKLGRELDLFHIEEHSPGMIFWHDKGWTVYRLLEEFIRSKIRKAGYIEVRTPILVDRSLWEASGHWDKFQENMFTVPLNPPPLAGGQGGAGETSKTLSLNAKQPSPSPSRKREGDEQISRKREGDEQIMAVKPMNCPCHVQIFNQGIKSYRDLPLRMAEFGTCHRNEPSGSMHGIMRVRGFVQDDAHIFCTPNQITSETIDFCNLLLEVYKAFGFEDVKVKFSDRPPTRAGDDATWDKAENALIEAVKATGLDYTLNPGEGAFYGPKLEFVLTDAIGRDWQCGTLQVDFVLPERLDANYVGEDGNKHRPVMLHRAILGSMERFIGILIEEYAGKFPVWLAPTQAVIATITDSSKDYAEKIHATLEAAGIRAELDIRNEKINYKVREHSNAKVPYILAVGDREVEAGTVAVRTLGEQGQKVMPFAEFMEMIQQQVRSK